MSNLEHKDCVIKGLKKTTLKIKSTELVDIINDFRKVESETTNSKYVELRHNDFMTKIKKELEALKKLGVDNQRNFSLVKYLDKKGENRPCFELNRDGMLQMLNSESALVRYKTIEYINKLEETVKNQSKKTKSKSDNSLKEKEIEARLKNARAREANILLKICNNPNLPKEYVQVLQSKATEIITGQAILPLPVVERKTYSATEIGQELGISANKVGSLANKHNLKTDEYGNLYHDKSPYSNKEVETFRYYDNVIPVLAKILSK